MNILLTGGTGLIGQKLVRKLAKEENAIYLLVRPQSKDKAKSLFKDLPQITFIEGDIEETDVVKNIYTVSEHLDKIDCLVHLAAYYHLEATLEEAYFKNVVGTQNIILLLSKMKNIKFFHYFSTYTVNPVAQGAVNEDFLAGDDLPFNDEYSKTKNHAEHLVRNNVPKHIKTIIHRPGIIIGDSETGAVEKEDGPYYFFEFIRNLRKLNPLPLKLPRLPLPVIKNSQFPVLPVNVLAEWCAHIIMNPKEKALSCYHLVPHPMIKTQDFLEASMEALGVPLKIHCLNQTKLIAPLLPLLKIPKEAAFYMNQQTLFDRSQLMKDYPELKTPSYEEYMPIIIKGYLEKKA